MMMMDYNYGILSYFPPGQITIDLHVVGYTGLPLHTHQNYIDLVGRLTATNKENGSVMQGEPHPSRNICKKAVFITTRLRHD